MPFGVAGRQVDQDRLTVDDDRAIVVEHRDRAGRVERQERRLLMLAALEVDQVFLIVQAQEAQEQPHLVTIAG